MSAMKVRAQAVRELEDRYGRVTAEALVREARNPKHPLHGDFRWDDKEAAHQDRLNTARQIISSVRIIITHSKKKISSVGYVKDPTISPNKQGYIAVNRLVSERDAALDTILAEVSKVQSALERAQELAVALDLQDEFNEALAAATALKSRLRRGPALSDLSEGFVAN